MTVQTRTAPKNSRLIFFGNTPSPTLLATLSATTDPPPDQGSLPVPPDPTAPPSETERLDAQDATLADHEDRIAKLEATVGIHPDADRDGSGAAEPPPAASPPAAAPPAAAAAAVDAGAIYARISGRASGPMPATIANQDGRPMLDGAAINARHGAHRAAVAARTPGKPVPAGTEKLDAGAIYARLNRAQRR